jgi:tetratricopeptide (TPR) repeat protein
VLAAVCQLLQMGGNVEAAEPAQDITYKSEEYIARLRTLLPQNWFEREFHRQRSFPALARSRQLAREGKQDVAVDILKNYLASDPNDLVVQFEYLVLSASIGRYTAVIEAADKISAQIPNFAPALFHRGLAKAALNDNRGAIADLAAAASSGDLIWEDNRYAQRALGLAAVASPAVIDAFEVVDRQSASDGADPMLVVAKGQLLERLSRPTDASLAYDEAARRSTDANDTRAAWLRGAELALKHGDDMGALSRAQAAWKLSPGNAEVAVVLVEAASRAGRTDVVEEVDRDTEAAASADPRIREAVANALYQLGRYDQSAVRFDELAQTAGPTEEYRLRRAAGFAFQAAQNAAGALSELQRAAEINPEPETLSAVAEAALEAGRVDVATTQFRALADVTEGMNQRHALERLSVTEEQRGRFENAYAALDQIPTEQRDVGVERRSAILAGKAGHHEAAVAHASRLAGLQPNRANLRALGEMQLLAGQTTNAIESFERAIKAGQDDDPSLSELLANAFLATGRSKRAAAEFHALAERAKWYADEYRHANEYRLQLARGVAALKSGDPARATALFPKADKLDPSAAPMTDLADEYRLRLAAGFAALKSGDPARALSEFRRAVKLEAAPESLQAAAETSIQVGRFAEAVGYLERLSVTGRDPLAKARALEHLSIVYELMNDIKNSARALSRRSEIVPSNPTIIRRQAALAQKLGDHNGMLAHLRNLVSLEPNEENLADLANAQIGVGQHSAAAKILEALLAGPNLPAEKRAGYLDRLGVVEALLGHPKRAETLFLKAYQLSPAHPAEWLAQAAETAMQMKAFEDVVKYYRTVINDPRIPRKSRAVYNTRLGVALAQLTRNEEALVAYDTAERLGGATSSLHENRGATLMRLGRPAAAASDFRAAYHAHPRADLALSLGYAYQAARQPGPAIVFLRRALVNLWTLSPAQRREASAALGYAYSETEQHHLAARCFEAALRGQLRPTSSDVCVARSQTAGVQ